jgi:hypothetical protein
MKFGKAINGTAVHFVRNDEETSKGFGFARCDQRLVVSILEGASIADVTCSTCKRFSAYKNAKIESPEKNEPEQKSAEIDNSNKKKKSVDTELPIKSEEQENEDFDQQSFKSEIISINPPPEFTAEYYVEQILEAQRQATEKILTSLAELKAELKKEKRSFGYVDLIKDSESKKDEPEEPTKKVHTKLSEEKRHFEPLIEQIKKAQEEKKIFSDDEKHFEVKKFGEKINIFHLPSERIVFSNIDPKSAKEAIKYLNNVKTKWSNPMTPVPKNFVTEILKAVKAAYKATQSKQEIGFESLKESQPEADKTRTIKRRQKSTNTDNKRIKRRKK